MLKRKRKAFTLPASDCCGDFSCSVQSTAVVAPASRSLGGNSLRSLTCSCCPVQGDSCSLYTNPASDSWMELLPCCEAHCNLKLSSPRTCRHLTRRVPCISFRQLFPRLQPEQVILHHVTSCMEMREHLAAHPSCVLSRGLNPVQAPGAQAESFSRPIQLCASTERGSQKERAADKSSDNGFALKGTPT